MSTVHGAVSTKSDIKTEVPTIPTCRRQLKSSTGTSPPPSVTLHEMKASFKSNKGTLTRLSNQVKIRAETFVSIKSPGSAAQLNESYKFLAKCNFLHRAVHQLALEDKDNSAAWIAAQEQL